MKTLLTISLLLFIPCLQMNGLSAQPPPEFDGPRGPHGHWGKMSANIENLRLIKLLEAVDLTEEQSEKFVPLFHGFRKDIKQLREERRALVEEIKQMLDGGSDVGRLKTEMAKLKENKVQMNRRHDQFLADSEAILTAPQMARLMIFQEGFEREMLESLRQFRKHRGRNPDMNEEGKI